MDLKTLFKIHYGMYIVCAKTKDNRMNGQIANTCFQITSEPPTIAISINKQNLTHMCIECSKAFTVSILTEEAPMTFIGQFGFKSGRDIDKLKGVNFQIGQTGLPIILDYTLGYIEAEVINSVDAGTHTIFIGKVVNAETIHPDAKPMTYAFYHEVKKGKSPKTAPTYIKEEKQAAEPPKAATPAAKWRCTVCNYIYDPEKGDPDSGIAPGTPFEQIPDSWACPVCGAKKDEFEKVM